MFRFFAKIFCIKYSLSIDIKKYINAQGNIDKNKIKAPLRIAVWESHIGRKYDSNCYTCGRPISVNTFEAGHIVPRSKGGICTIENLRPVCSMCNKSMGSMNMILYKDNLNILELSSSDVELLDTFIRYNVI